MANKSWYPTQLGTEEFWNFKNQNKQVLLISKKKKTKTQNQRFFDFQILKKRKKKKQRFFKNSKNCPTLVLKCKLK